MLLLDTVTLICQAFAYFKDTYRTLRENEEAMRDVLDELLIYEALIGIYAQKLNEEENPAQSVYAAPIQMFGSGVSGFRKLISEYNDKKGLMAKAWNFCRSWCCTQQNSSRIKKHTEVWRVMMADSTRDVMQIPHCFTIHKLISSPFIGQEITNAVRLLNFSAELLITQKVDHLRLQQTEMQAKLCDFIENLNLDNLDRLAEATSIS